MSKLREAALQRLHSRSARLVRLLQLEAPDMIIVSEVCLLANAAKVLAPEAWAKEQMRFELAGLKPAMGFCAEPECESPITDGDLDVCSEHAEDDDEVDVTGNVELQEEEPEQAVPKGCQVSPISSAGCVRGTRGCAMLHEEDEHEEQQGNAAEDPEPQPEN